MYNWIDLVSLYLARSTIHSLLPEEVGHPAIKEQINRLDESIRCKAGDPVTEVQIKDFKREIWLNKETYAKDVKPVEPKASMPLLMLIMPVIS